jgi:hypothetical protein
MAAQNSTPSPALRQIKPEDKFGEWTAIEPSSTKVGYWLCKCVCGTIRDVYSDNLRRNKTSSCGRCFYPPLVVGQKFHRWEVIDITDQVNPSCRCECGATRVISRSFLYRGHTKGCRRCSYPEIGRQHRTHGMRNIPEYGCWIRLRQRCQLESLPSYSRYGGRGIKVCERWAGSFEAFYEDMGERPSPDLTVDRRDNDGHYSCGKCDECRHNGWIANCRWATKSEQARNRRSNHLIEHDGRSLTITEWSEITGIDPVTIRRRISAHGWDTARTLTTPVDQTKGQHGLRKS